MKDYSDKKHYQSKSPIPLIVIWIIATYAIVDIAWGQIFNYFGF